MISEPWQKAFVIRAQLGLAYSGINYRYLNALIHLKRIMKHETLLKLHRDIITTTPAYSIYSFYSIDECHQTADCIRAFIRYKSRVIGPFSSKEVAIKYCMQKVNPYITYDVPHKFWRDGKLIYRWQTGSDNWSQKYWPGTKKAAKTLNSMLNLNAPEELFVQSVIEWNIAELNYSEKIGNFKEDIWRPHQLRTEPKSAKSSRQTKN